MAPCSLANFRDQLDGRLVLPGDSEYETLRRINSFNETTDKRPAMIVRCASTQDAARAVALAREQSLAAAVHGGGHDVLGASVCEAGMVVDLSMMKRISIDPQRHTAHVEAGVLAGELNGAAGQHGLAAVLGCDPAVGIGGLTLGGGYGFLMGKHGAACDNLLGADLITADGQMMRASADENPDMFWAIRGGGGNFGIVTSFDYRLHPLDRALGGLIVYRADIAEFLAFYDDFMSAAPDELMIELVITALGRPLIIAIVCWSGERAEGERVLQRFRSFAPPLFDAIAWLSYPEMLQRVGLDFLLRKLGLGGALRQALRANASGPEYKHWRGGSMTGMSRQAAAEFAAIATRAPRSHAWQIGVSHYMHGEVCRIDESATPLLRSAGHFSYLFGTSWRDPAHSSGAIDWVAESSAAMRGLSTAATYINFLSSDDETDVAISYGRHYPRLSTLKRRYDPTNFFRLNRNIRPQADTSTIDCASALTLSQ